MKTLVVYYSYEGNCAFVAENIKAAMNAEMLEIKTADQKKRTGAAKYFWGGSQVVMNKKPALKPYAVNPGAFDLIVIGTPVWAGSPSPAIVSFLEKTKISGKKIALFCCHAGGKGRVFEKLKAILSGNTIAGEIDFLNPAKDDPEKNKRRIEEWVKTLSA